MRKQGKRLTKEQLSGIVKQVAVFMNRRIIRATMKAPNDIFGVAVPKETREKIYNRHVKNHIGADGSQGIYYCCNGLELTDFESQYIECPELLTYRKWEMKCALTLSQSGT